MAGLHATVADLRTDNHKLEAERDQVPYLRLCCVVKMSLLAFGYIVVARQLSCLLS
jgi:hypothetical protein